MAALRLMILALLIAVVTALAQWPSYPTKGVPMKDGKADLEAPAPRTADGRVDFSGVWENARGTPGANNTAQSGPPAATFFNIGAGFKDGLPLQPWAAELLKQRRDDNSKDNPDAHCLPMGMMQFHLQPQPRRMVQTRDLLLIVYEANYGLRTIFMDGRPLPPSDADPWWYGYSVGRWEDNDTLVVETTRFRDLGWLDVWGSPLTTDATVTERYRRPSFGRLEIEVTIDDPKAYRLRSL